MNKNTVVGFLVTLITVLPLSIFLTLHLQLSGSLLGFFLSGLAGGYLSRVNKFKAFLIGLTGSLLACLLGFTILLAIANSPTEPPQFLVYIASYILWLNVGSPTNLTVVVALFGGIGGIVGNLTEAWLKKTGK